MMEKLLSFWSKFEKCQQLVNLMTERALNSIFQQWGISANQEQWNISGELCSGAASATDTDTFDFDSLSGPNPYIKCVCTYSNNTLCHITRLKVYALDVVGVIPDELWTLTFLTHLNLGQNDLTGPLSASIGNLTSMQYLSFGINALSGELPKELGKLTDIRSFAIGSNNFSGPLPSELGNWTKLEQLYIDSSGVSGEIPSTFANLQNLVTVWASDTELTGKIPDFIGNWSKLTRLRFQGNSFGGSIPSSFSNLTAMTELRISDLSNGSSTLAFIKDMKSLSSLELRNSNISDSIPSNIGEYQSLQHLDLSFNNIGGEIPDSLFKLSSLTHLFLGNNTLSGTLPAQKSTSLLNMNVVANNLAIDNSKSSVLPFGLNCLQRNFPCNRGSGIYYNFSIKCGGPQLTSFTGIVYERDDENLGAASYFMTGTRRWGISNVGYFTGSTVSRSEVTDTLDSMLFQTARTSASSLRYYGLGLENGNYTVILHFAEMAILKTTGWESIGRRIFDIYIQGIRVLQDFDIKKEAGGVSQKAIQKNFTAQVSENYLEIHLFWAGKGTCCIPAQSTYGPSISAISATPDFIPTVSNNPPTSNKKNRTGIIVGVVVGVGLVSFVSILTIFWIVRRRKIPSNDDEVLLGIEARPYTFSYTVLKTATEDFSPANKLGEGGFGPVYKVCDHSNQQTVGKLGDGRIIAVKQLSVASRQGKSQFVAEIVAISAVQHRNLAWQLHENNREVELVDSRLSEFNADEVKRMIGVALLCTQALPSLRPPMSSAVAMLCGDVEVNKVTSKPGYLTDWKFDDITGFTTSDKTTNETDYTFFQQVQIRGLKFSMQKKMVVNPFSMSLCR
ncbi:hypothetical protein EZV62_001139 [Acer yangbiense]|uniref:non-specific serine/threonine protein kinase n=1 Tax=Acer yangbiense TaxID=1000413 RepID=A0A5C7IT95_9ROSI|nr:hypothetical protein EZV62_001139 [Acer yangbiense]